MGRCTGVVSAVVVVLLATPARGQEEAWRMLVEVRESLTRGGVQRFDFTQTYVPAGFASGESEEGKVALDLPDCVRWDYADPYPKSYLLCHARLHAWNPGEPVGHVFIVDHEEQPGLDLLRLSVPDLRLRYEAEQWPAAEGETRTIALSPRRPEDTTLRDVRIEIVPDGSSLRGLSYIDGEGNRTMFEFGSPRPTSDPALFTLPEDVRWEHEGVSGGTG